MMPKRRDLAFDLPAERVCNWHGRGRHVSHFFNALSLCFPAGERFFIQSVRHYRARLSDGELKAATAAFIGQEAMHGREHCRYNELLARSGLPAARLESVLAATLALTQKLAPPAAQLAVTLALEHFTATLADLLLCEPDMLAGSERSFERLWKWHALEETEHKAVAYDVWRRAVQGPGRYPMRCIVMAATGAVFWTMVSVFCVVLAESDPQARRRPRGYLQLLDYLFLRPGLQRRSVPGWLAYFTPGFHPWQHDNRELLAPLRTPDYERAAVPVDLAA